MWQTKPMLLPFVPVTGMRHLPLLGSLCLPHAPRQPKPNKCMSRQSVHKLQCQFPDILEEYQARIATISSSSPELSAKKLIEQAWTECRLQCQHLPVGREAQPSSGAPPITALVKPTITALWQTKSRILKMPKRGGLRCYIRLWRAHA